MTDRREPVYSYTVDGQAYDLIDLTMYALDACLVIDRQAEKWAAVGWDYSADEGTAEPVCECETDDNYNCVHVKVFIQHQREMAESEVLWP